MDTQVSNDVKKYLFSRIWNHPKRPFVIDLLVTAFVSFGVGIEVGYIIAQKEKNKAPDKPKYDYSKFRTYMEARQKEIDERDNFRQEIDEVTHDILSPEESPLVGTNDIEWNWDHELEHRSSEEPYVLHRDEFFNQETDFEQISITYFEGDDIMVDDGEIPIYDYAQNVGNLRFGHGSGDPNVFYVRNEPMEVEYEVLFDPGMYSVEVLHLEKPEGYEDRYKGTSKEQKMHVPRENRDVT